jgi:hypothetical protein
MLKIDTLFCYTIELLLPCDLGEDNETPGTINDVECLSNPQILHLADLVSIRHSKLIGQGALPKEKLLDHNSPAEYKILQVEVQGV